MRTVRYAAAVIFVFIMFLAAWFSSNNIFIFPEIFAILIGMLCNDKVPWKTDGVHTLLMMTISAFIGIAIVKALPVPVYFQSVAGVILVGFVLLLTNCTVMPCVAACLFPIYFNESSFMYPVLVAVMVGIAIGIRKIFINKGLLEASVKFRYLPDFEKELKLWLMIIMAFSVLGIIPHFSGYKLILAPPVAVTLAECSYKSLSGKRVKIWFVITVAAVIGVLMRSIGVDMFFIPGYIMAPLAAALALLEMRLMNMMFPPAGAVVLLTFLIEGNMLFFYPPMISIGAAAVLYVSSIINNRAGD